MVHVSVKLETKASVTVGVYCNSWTELSSDVSTLTLVLEVDLSYNFYNNMALLKVTNVESFKATRNNPVVTTNQ